MLKIAREGLEIEKRQKEEIKKKVLAQMHQREKMLKEAQTKKEIEQKQIKKEETDQAKKLQEDLQQEREHLARKKEAERQAARLVISENEVEKKKRQEQEELDRRAAIKLIEKTKADQEAEIQRRNDQVKAREQKIKAIMDKMADGVNGNKDKLLQKQQEKDYITMCIEADQKAKQQDMMRKRQKYEKDIEVRAVLSNQIAEKRSKEEADKAQNKVFVDLIYKQDHEYNQKQKEDAELRRQQLIQLSDQQKNQMKKVYQPLGKEAHLVKKHQLGGMMNEEEARMNRKLLQEIAQKKKLLSRSPSPTSTKFDAK